MLGKRFKVEVDVTSGTLVEEATGAANAVSRKGVQQVLEFTREKNVDLEA
jgi:hypothetical protein